MKIKVGINGFGRMGRLTMRALFESNEIEIVKINDPAGDAITLAHLMNFDSVHGKWSHEALVEGNDMVINDQRIEVTQHVSVAENDWSMCDLVIEASGKLKSKQKLAGFFAQGVKQVVVTAPVKEEGVLNVVMGVNHHDFDAQNHEVVTAASCTTNCLAPVVKVLQDNIGIKHGSMTTIHDITNTQTIIDAPHKDLRRARSCGTSLIPTTTGSATAITHIFPELKGKLNGHAVRVPLTNASITDCVFEVSRETTVEEINGWMEQAANSELSGILGYETRPLVSIDYKTDPRSAIIDALSTMVVNGTQVKLYVWYDNEWGYANRTADLVRLVVAKRWG
ncbi:ArsJ-associated glyceraldehyde-3-phosphate dehydrogenase [Pseudoalteromonas luteoviolacea]|nr:ArsJ-associated glyceraldehyde-3-phosphate dehydrogenase [Pseudoalteromonas luteoviolacea]